MWPARERSASKPRPSTSLYQTQTRTFEVQVTQGFGRRLRCDPRRIRLVFSGAARRLTPDGDLMAGALGFHKPRVYQEDREAKRRYELHGSTVRFLPGPYDRARPYNCKALPFNQSAAISAP
jgi:hypothetical protein